MIDQFKMYGNPDDEINFVLRDPEHLYTYSEVADLLDKAEKLGFSLDKGSELEELTVRELERLVTVRN